VIEEACKDGVPDNIYRENVHLNFLGQVLVNLGASS